DPAGGIAPAPIVHGVAEFLKEGPDGALVAYGAMVDECWRAAALLKDTGIDVTVVNARFARPIDQAMVAKVMRSGPLVMTVEDHQAACGFGALFAKAAADCDASRQGARLVVRGIPDRLITHGTPAEQYRDAGLTAAQIADGYREALAADKRGAKRVSA
ncbi:MAG TPA: transketolase C-terminal domain-containing protein, partial [Planctomycetota bacterium]|nr:transketolase C-terminal domain-containing protein [Planctomycetota bacterium]